MFFLGVGIVLLLMKYFEIGPVASWSWFIILAPFLAAIIWWEMIVPALGIRQKSGEDVAEQAKQQRIKKQLNKR